MCWYLFCLDQCFWFGCIVGYSVFKKSYFVEKEKSHSFQRNRSKVSEKNTINLILGAMNNIFHKEKFVLLSAFL